MSSQSNCTLLGGDTPHWPPLLISSVAPQRSATLHKIGHGPTGNGKAAAQTVTSRSSTFRETLLAGEWGVSDRGAALKS